MAAAGLPAALYNGATEKTVLDATALASAVRAGNTSAAEVLAAARSRSEAAPDLRAFVHEDWGKAERAAKEVDRRRARGEALGPLAGVPVSIKDIIAVAGLPLTGGSAAFANNVAAFTAPAVERLTEAGAVVVGKTNCPEFAFGAVTENAVAGRTLNPRFPGVTPGGSSGGEAAAVAAGITAVGLGTDYGGSLRWPAQCVGITALRPTPHVVPDLGIVPGAGGWFGSAAAVRPGAPLQGTTQVIGPLARSIRDLRLALAVVAGLGPGEEEVNPRDLVVAWSAGTRLGPVRQEVAAMMSNLADLLASRVRVVRHAPGIFAPSLAAYNRLRDVDPMVDHAAAVAGREEQILPANRAAIRRSMTAGQQDIADAAAWAETAKRKDLEVFDNADVVLLPVAGGPAADVLGGLDIDGERISGWEIMGQCRAVTLSGAPVVSLPLAVSAEGLPLSVQVIARPGADFLALDVAQWLAGTASVPQGFN